MSETVGALNECGIVLGGGTDQEKPRGLLRRFSCTVPEPVPFELFLHKADGDFAESRFREWFESIEPDSGTTRCSYPEPILRLRDNPRDTPWAG